MLTTKFMMKSHTFTAFKSEAALFIFLTAAVAGLASDFGGALIGWPHHHTMAHLFFGLGFPFLWVAIFSMKRDAVRAQWQVEFDSKFVRPLGDGFWFGASITAIWSIWNEILVYQIYNPTHGADWHHWMADHIGLLIAYSLLLVFLRGKHENHSHKDRSEVGEMRPSQGLIQ